MRHVRAGLRLERRARRHRMITELILCLYEAWDSIFETWYAQFKAWEG